MSEDAMNNNDSGAAPAHRPQNANAPTQERDAAQRPIRTIKDGAISASVWERASDDGPQYSAKVVRKWRDEEGRFHESNSYSEYDLTRLADVARNTSDVIDGMRQSRERSLDPTQNQDQSREAYIDERQAQPQQQSRKNTRARNDR